MRGWLWFAAGLAVLGTVCTNAVISLVRWGRIDAGLLLIGVVDAVVTVPAVVLLLAVRRRAGEERQAGKEETLQDMNGMLGALLDAIPDMVFFKDVEGRYVVVNKALEQTLGRSCDELVGRTVEDLFPPGAAAICRSSDEAAMQAAEPIRVEEELSNRNGTRRWTESIKAPLRDEQRGITGIVSVSRDITERKQMERSLRESEEKLRILFDSANDGMEIMDLDGAILDANRAAYEPLGYSREEFLAMNVAQLDHPTYRATTADRLARLKQHEPVVAELELLAKDGSVMPVEINARVVDLAGKNVIFSIVRDITDRKRAENHRLESEKRYRALFDQSPDGILIIDRDGRIVEFNETACRHLGYSREEFRSLGISDIDPAETQAAVHARIEGIIRAGRAEFDVAHRTKTGEFRDMHVVAQPVLLEGNTVIQAIWQDVTESRRAARELREINARLDTLVNAIPDLVYFKDGEGRYQIVNRALEASLGRSRAEILGKTDEGLLPPATIAACRQSDQAVLRARAPVRSEEEYPQRNGEVHYLETIKAPIYDGANVISGLVGISRDITERKRMELSLRQSEEKFRTLFASASDGIFIVDLQGRILDANAVGYERLGYTKDELLALTLDRLDHPSYAAMLPERLERLRRTGQLTIESAHVKKDGTIMPVEINTRVIEFQGRQVLLSVIRDVTERKRAEDALRTSEARLNEAQRIAHVGNWEWDVTTNRVFWSDELYRIYGYEPHEIEPDYGLILSTMHPESGGQFQQAIEEALAGTRTLDMDYTFFRKDSSTAVLHTIGRVIRNAAGKPERMVGIVQDITLQKLSQEALQESEEKFRSIFDNANDGILIADVASQRFTVANKTACAMLGYEAEEIPTLGIRDIHPPRDVDRVLAEFEKQVRGEKTIAEDLPVLRKDGSVFYADVGAATIHLGGKAYAIGIFRDITGRKRADEALRDKTRQLEDLTRNLEKRVEEEIAIRNKNEQMLIQQSKLAAMGEMLGAIAHQWRQPLNVVGLIVQNMEDAYASGKLDGAYLEQMVEKAMAQIMRMSKTIDDFRNFYKPDKGKAIFDAMRAVGDVLALVSAQLAADHIGYRLTCHTHHVSYENENDIVICAEKAVEGYKNEFEHVVLNLVNNAREAILERRRRGGLAAAQRGYLRFDFYQNADRVVLTIGDNGGGIPPAVLGRVFDPYFTTKGPSKGTGLGLYMSKTIVEKHMLGTLSVENAADGALFTIDLPYPGKRDGHEHV